MYVPIKFKQVAFPAPTKLHIMKTFIITGNMLALHLQGSQKPVKFQTLDMKKTRSDLRVSGGEVAESDDENAPEIGGVEDWRCGLSCCVSICSTRVYFCFWSFLIKKCHSCKIQRTPFMLQTGVWDFEEIWWLIVEPQFEVVASYHPVGRSHWGCQWIQSTNPTG